MEVDMCCPERKRPFIEHKGSMKTHHLFFMEIINGVFDGIPELLNSIFLLCFRNKLLKQFLQKAPNTTLEGEFQICFYICSVSFELFPCFFVQYCRVMLTDVYSGYESKRWKQYVKIAWNVVQCDSNVLRHYTLLEASSKTNSNSTCIIIVIHTVFNHHLLIETQTECIICGFSHHKTVELNYWNHEMMTNQGI